MSGADRTTKKFTYGEATKSSAPAVSVASSQSLTDWLEHEMPAGTVISNPAWWAKRIAGRVRLLQSALDDPRAESGGAYDGGVESMQTTQAGQGEAVGEIVPRFKGYTVVQLFDSDLPVGTKLYTRPAERAAVPDAWYRAMERALPFLVDEANKYEDDGNNEPLDVADTIRDLLESAGFATTPQPVIQSEANHFCPHGRTWDDRCYDDDCTRDEQISDDEENTKGYVCLKCGHVPTDAEVSAKYCPNCDGRPAERAAVLDGWLPITSAPDDGEMHVRGLAVRGTDGTALYWDACAGYIDTEDGRFVGPGGDDFGWDAEDFTHWHPLAAAPQTAQEGRSDG